MLLAKTKLGLSTIKGIGLFADQDIPQGFIFGTNKDNFGIVRYTEDQWKALEDNLSKESFDQVRMYTYKNRADGFYWLNLDNTRFINHSKDPNIAIAGDNDIAIRDIGEGGEILIDYTTFYDLDYFEDIMRLS